MRVLFISQCTKNALIETRRVLDQFAERKGDSVWETHITERGLDTIRKLLKATARRNTAVACHLYRGRLQTELQWIVGDGKKFNREGVVPTNITRKDVLRVGDENNWNTGEGIAIIAGIAGLFHDFGKANELFQKKLKGKSKSNYEPFRHEWISLLIFRQFVGGLSDREWIEKLSQVSLQDEERLLDGFPRNREDLKKNPLRGLPKIAKFIGWLILSHHRLPVPPKDNNHQQPSLEEDRIKRWMDDSRFSALWNSPNANEQGKEKDLKQVQSFPYNTPVKSKKWCALAKKMAVRAIKYYDLLDRDWFQDRFSMHLARAALMLSDHVFSADLTHTEYQDRDYEAYANTDRASGCLKQKLDEHNIGVARGAFLIAKSFPKVRETLPSISRHKNFKQSSRDARFSWQDKAYDLACGLRKASCKRGFFGVNLASTGCGKTLANARIMYGFADEKEGCRFTIALGLRILTLQTGDALKDRLKLKDDDLAVIIGTEAFQQLYEHKNEEEYESKRACGSESLEDLVDEGDYVRYEGSLDDGYLSKWLKSSAKLHKIVSAPLLVCTIDHLILATEGCRGGKQIAPLLRLLTSDLVLDEPDDFDVADLPALCRLVNFAGVFGSRVLLSSATLPPSIVKALFEAYASGRKAFHAACKQPENEKPVLCAWFDEFGVAQTEHSDGDSYSIAHSEFIESRIAELDKQVVLRRASLAPVEEALKDKNGVHEALAKAISSNMYSLHDQHHQIDPSSGKKVSIGLVRMANINPMVAVVKSLLSEAALGGYCIHFCVYHSRFTMLVRSWIEKMLDNVLTRHDSTAIWEKSEIVSALAKSQAPNHIFVVFATPVAEVGRDHDYDWAIVEPSSMRSIIQLAGRVQRHRRIPPLEANIMILEQNIRGLQKEDFAFIRPGFESKRFQLVAKDLVSILHPDQFKEVTAKPRLRPSKTTDYSKNLVDLEHARLDGELFGVNKDKNSFHASLWWKFNPDWCGEIQRLSPFRKQEAIKIEYIDYLEEEGDVPKLHVWPKGEERVLVEKMTVEREDFIAADGNHPWIDCDIGQVIEQCSREMELSVREVSLKFARVSLDKLDNGNKWLYSSIFGFFRT